MLGSVALLVLICSLQTTEAAGRTAPVTDEALRRIAAALVQPERLRVTTPAATFRTEVRQHPWFDDVPHPWDFAGGGTATTAPQAGRPVTQPLVTVEVLPLLRSARTAWTERHAREEVTRAIAEFCATHECR